MTEGAPLAATVVMPTTGDRAAVLARSIPTVLGQTEPRIELMVLGDGVTGRARELIAETARADGRVRFFDHPKTRRRAEAERHAGLLEARGEIVCYLPDRDLMLPGHVAEMARLLADADFAHGLRIQIDARDRLRALPPLDLAQPRDRRRLGLHARLMGGIPLGQAAHRREAYLALPEGWAPTPPGRYTDGTMWAKFAADPACRMRSGTRLTVLSFPRAPKSDWPPERRAGDQDRWLARMAEPGFEAWLAEAAREAEIPDIMRPDGPWPLRLRRRLRREADWLRRAWRNRVRGEA